MPGHLIPAAALAPLQALLRRLEVRLAAKGISNEGPQGLLRRLFPRAPADKPIDRYPVRVFLCAYMVLEHPQVVFNGDVSGAWAWHLHCVD